MLFTKDPLTIVLYFSRVILCYRFGYKSFVNKNFKKNIFLGKIYWIFNGQRFYSHPRSIYDLGLPLFVEALDDVFIWGKNEKTYLFYQNLYWR